MFCPPEFGRRATVRHEGGALDWTRLGEGEVEERGAVSGRGERRADRWTGLALVATVLGALALGVWLWPRATAWWPSESLAALERGGPSNGSRPLTVYPTRTPIGLPTLVPAVIPSQADPSEPPLPTATSPAASGETAWRGRVDRPTSLVQAPGSGVEVVALRSGSLVLVEGEQPGPDGEPWYRARQPGGPEGWLPAQQVVAWTAPRPTTVAQRGTAATPGVTETPPVASGTPTDGGTPAPSDAGRLAGPRSIVFESGAQGVRLRALPLLNAAPGPFLANGTLVTTLEYAVDAEGRAWARVDSGVLQGWAPVSSLASAGG